MTQDAIAKLLSEHLLTDDGEWLWCECGKEIDRRDEWCAHVAELIAFGFAS
jgi:hypothetical protein